MTDNTSADLSPGKSLAHIKFRGGKRVLWANHVHYLDRLELKSTA